MPTTTSIPTKLRTNSSFAAAALAYGLVLAACAGPSEASTSPRLANFTPDETREEEQVLHVEPEPESPSSDPPEHGDFRARWSDRDEDAVDCLLDPSVPACGPQLPAQAIHELIRAQLPALRACWAAIPSETWVPLELSFTIVSDGSVGELRLNDALPSELDACLRREIGALQFPPLGHEGSVTVSYPRY